MSLSPPIVVAEGLDVMLFRSQADAERFVEARDVAGQTLRGWDATGRELRFDIGDAICIDLAPVHLSLMSAVAVEPETLRTVLHDFLTETGAMPPRSATLAELLTLALAHAGYSR